MKSKVPQDFDAIILAAGAGRRFGGGKLRAPWGEATVLDAVLIGVLAAPVRRVVLVTGADPSLGAGRADLLRVQAEDWDNGMAASLRAGIGALPADSLGAFLFLGDMPRVPRCAPAALAQALRAGAQAAAPVFDGQRGHPVLVCAALYPALMRLSGDEGARSVLTGLGDQLALVVAPDDGVLFDVDRPEDLAGAPARA